MSLDQHEFLNTAAFLGRTPRAAALSDLRVIGGEARLFSGAIAVARGRLSDASPRERDLADRFTLEQLEAMLRECREDQRELVRIARGEIDALPPSAAPSAARDEGSGDDPPPSREAVVQELVRATHAVRLAHSITRAARAGVTALAAPRGMTRDEARARVEAALRAQVAAYRACLAAGVEPAVPARPPPWKSPARLLASPPDRRSRVDLAIELSRRCEPEAGLVLLTMIRESLLEGGHGLKLSETGLARATRELDADIGAGETARGFGELVSAGLVREDGLRIELRRPSHPIVKVPLTMRAASNRGQAAPTSDLNERLRAMGVAHG